MSAPILVVCGHGAGRPRAASDELLGLAGELARRSGGDVVAVTLGESDGANDLIARGARTVYEIEHALLVAGHVEAMTAALAQVCRDVGPAVVLLDHDSAGADLAPRLAFRLGGSVATGCVAVDYAADRYLCTRPRQGGIAREVVSFRNAPVVATVRAGNHDAAVADQARQGHIVRVAFEPSGEDVRTRVLERRKESNEAGPCLEEARIIVAGGRGLNGPEGFCVLAELAQALGGVVGASRVPCDLGWCPRSWQIGLTGKTVIPELYIAVGISGASHHMAGCGNAKTIVAVNTDPDAAIFRDARYGVIGDYQALIPALTAEIRKQRPA